MDDNNKERKIIFEAELKENNNIEIKLYSKFLPALLLAERMLNVEIDKLMIDERIKNLQSPIIHEARGGIINFVRNRLRK